MKNSKKPPSSIRQNCVLAKVIVIGTLTLACVGHFLINLGTYIEWSAFQTNADIGIFAGSLVSLTALFVVLMSMFSYSIKHPVASA
ncbi:MAG: hypothetical protein AB8G15_18735 [Saprospiraceae bacterium]